MKKFLLVTSLILLLANASYAVQDEVIVPAVSPADLEDETFFKSPLNNVMPEIREVAGFDDYSFDYQGRTYKELDPDKMPLFKQMRLRITNRIMGYDAEGKLLPEKPKNDEPFGDKLQKMKFWNKKKVNETDDGSVFIPAEGSIADTINSEIEASEQTLSLEGSINKQVTEKQLQLDSDNVSYDEETGDMVATGRPVLFMPPQNIKIIADKMTYNQDSNILKGHGHVVVLKDGLPTTSDYIEVDMNEETMQMDNLETITETMNMNAEKGVQKDSLLIFSNGSFHSDKSEVYRLSSRMVGPRFRNMILDDVDQSLFFGDPSGNKLTFDIEELYVEAKKNHDVIKAKNIDISRKGKHWIHWPSLTVYTNKERDYFEANYPEFGTRRKMGMFIGPGFVFGGPGGSVMKVIPFLNYQHGDFGFGGALKYKNTFNTTELGYGSAADVFFLRGRQRLDDNLFIQYSANSFMDEWFMGARMPKYMAEIYYDKRYQKRDFLMEGKTLQFRHRVGFGLMEDNDRNYYGEKIRSTGTATTRLRYMAEIKQSLYSYSRPEDRLYFDFGIAMQGSAAVYGTGETQFIGRIGPRAHLQYKNWMQDIGYFQSGYSDETPMPRFDMYRYGHSSIYISEIIRLNKYISVGWSGNVNLSNDAPNGKLFQENRFVVALGPDDLKVRLGYDFVRQTTYFGFDVAFDTKGTTINYGRMTIKNPERLGKQDKEKRKLAFAPASVQPEDENEVKVSSKFPGRKPAKAKPKVRKYAEVINIEDPNRETID